MLVTSPAEVVFSIDIPPVVVRWNICDVNLIMSMVDRLEQRSVGPCRVRESAWLLLRAFVDLEILQVLVRTELWLFFLGLGCLYNWFRINKSPGAVQLNSKVVLPSFNLKEPIISPERAPTVPNKPVVDTVFSPIPSYRDLMI
jgi:hypothetical protein